MTDLSHWNFAEHFSAYEVGALILGLEPRDSENEQWRIRVVTERMEFDYQEAIAAMSSEITDFPWGEDCKPRVARVALKSVKLASLIEDYFSRNWEIPLLDWLGDKRATRFENQAFSRAAIIEWLSAITMNSKYSFSRCSESGPALETHRWPWGDYHTEALGHLSAAATRFWSKFDASEPGTANTNVQVSEWLQTERKVSKNLADSIASILRLDGLAPGPRK